MPTTITPNSASVINKTSYKNFKIRDSKLDMIFITFHTACYRYAKKKTPGNTAELKTTITPP